MTQSNEDAPKKDNLTPESVPDQEAQKKSPLNLNDLASNPMRVGMARLTKQEKTDSKSKKRHWWSRKSK